MLRLTGSCGGKSWLKFLSFRFPAYISIRLIHKQCVIVHYCLRFVTVKKTAVWSLVALSPLANVIVVVMSGCCKLGWSLKLCDNSVSKKDRFQQGSVFKCIHRKEDFRKMWFWSVQKKIRMRDALAGTGSEGSASAGSDWDTSGTLT